MCALPVQLPHIFVLVLFLLPSREEAIGEICSGQHGERFFDILKDKGTVDHSGLSNHTEENAIQKLFAEKCHVYPFRPLLGGVWSSVSENKHDVE